MVPMVVKFLLFTGVVAVCVKTLPGIRIKNGGTVVLVALLYAVLNATLGKVLAFFAIPFIFLTLGLFFLVINTFILWLTDKILEDFEIVDVKTTFLAALMFTLGNLAIEAVFKQF